MKKIINEYLEKIVISLYEDDKLSPKKISSIVGYSTVLIKRWLVDNNINLRNNSEAHLGVKRLPLTEEHKRKISKANTGKKLSKETIEKMKKNHKYAYGENHPNWNGGMVTLVCEQCGNNYKKIRCLKDKSKFCCKKCQAEYLKGKNHKSNCRCASCKNKNGETLIGKDNPSWRGGKSKIKCQNCNKEFEEWVSQLHKNNFCCKQCYGKWLSDTNRGENHPNWRGGYSLKHYPQEFNKELKKKIRERDDHTCQECNKTEQELGYTLICHHIDYNKKNNSDDNLISLCRSCHAKTNFNRENWTEYYKNKVLNYVN